MKMRCLECNWTGSKEKLTKNGSNWYLKDKRNDKWATIGTFKG